MRPAALVIHHVLDLIPPTNHRNTWMVTCCQGDYSQQFRNKVEAYDAAYEHVRGIRLAHSLESGEYEFDDGSM